MEIAFGLLIALFAAVGIAQSKTAPETTTEAAPVVTKSINRLRIGSALDFAPDRSVRFALTYILEPTGYRFVLQPGHGTELTEIFNRRVPPSLTIRDYRTAESALLMLPGNDVRLVVDHQARLVTYEKIVVPDEHVSRLIERTLARPDQPTSSIPSLPTRG